MTLDSAVDAYAERARFKSVFPKEDFRKYNLLSFSKQFKYVSLFNNLYRRSSDEILILIAYPRGSSNTRHREGFIDYCVNQLTKYCPWEKETSSLFQGVRSNAPLAYKDFLDSWDAKGFEDVKSGDQIRLYRFFHQHVDDNDVIEDIPDQPWQKTETAEQKLLNQGPVESTTPCSPEDTITTTEGVDWSQSYRELQSRYNGLPDCRTWLDEMKVNFNNITLIQFMIL